MDDLVVPSLRLFHPSRRCKFTDLSLWTLPINIIIVKPFHQAKWRWFMKRNDVALLKDKQFKWPTAKAAGSPWIVNAKSICSRKKKQGDVPIEQRYPACFQTARFPLHPAFNSFGLHASPSPLLSATKHYSTPLKKERWKKRLFWFVIKNYDMGL